MLNNFLDKYSLKRKIFFAFFVIFIVFISQVIVSTNSVLQLQGDYELSITQNIVKDESNAILQLQERISSDLNHWSSGLDIEFVDDFEDILFNLDFLLNNTYLRFDALKNATDRLNDNPRNEILNMTEGNNLFLATSGILSEYYRNRLLNVTNYPSFSLNKEYKSELFNLKFQINELLSLINKFMLNQTTDTIIEINLLKENIRSSSRDSLLNLFSFNDELHTEFTNYNIELGNNITAIIQESSDLVTLIDNTLDFVNTNITEFDAIYASFSRLIDFVDSTENIVDIEVDRLIELENTLTLVLNQAFDTILSVKIPLVELINWASAGQSLTVKSFQRTMVNQILILLIFAIVGGLILAVVYSMIKREIISPIGIIALWSEYIAEGDLTKTRKLRQRFDEVGVLEKSFKHMNNNLRTIIKDVHDTNELIAYTSEELSSNTEEINATAEEVSAIAQSMATGSTQQAEIITTIVEELNEANDVVDSVISQITHNLSIVKDLSEQTNVLALNTAIEAANAGDYGRGFAVIAENIRKMSDQSSRTAKIITRDSKAILNQLQISFGIITEKIENVAAVSEETAASAEEVAASAEELTATIENISAKSAILNDQSVQSMISVSKFALNKEDLDRREKSNLAVHKELVDDDIDPKAEIKDIMESKIKEVVYADEVLEETIVKEEIKPDEIPDKIDSIEDEIKPDEILDKIDSIEDEIKPDEILDKIDSIEDEIKPDEILDKIDSIDEEIKPDEILDKIDSIDEEIKSDEILDKIDEEIKPDEILDKIDKADKTPDNPYDL